MLCFTGACGDICIYSILVPDDVYVDVGQYLPLPRNIFVHHSQKWVLRRSSFSSAHTNTSSRMRCALIPLWFAWVTCHFQKILIISFISALGGSPCAIALSAKNESKKDASFLPHMCVMLVKWCMVTGAQRISILYSSYFTLTHMYKYMLFGVAFNSLCARTICYLICIFDWVCGTAVIHGVMSDECGRGAM